MDFNPPVHVAMRILLGAAIAIAAAAAWAGPDDSGVAPAVTTQEHAAAPVREARREVPATLVAAPVGLGQRVQDKASDIAETALNFLGLPYRRGGTTEAAGFDCSGFTRYMFEMSVGLVLPRRADEQAKAPGLAVVKREELEPGDLVFFNTLRRTFSHVGIYVGDGKFIHAPKPGAEVRVEDMRFSYWAKRFTGARRADRDIDPMAPKQPASVRKAAAAR